MSKLIKLLFTSILLFFVLISFSRAGVVTYTRTPNDPSLSSSITIRAQVNDISSCLPPLDNEIYFRVEDANEQLLGDSVYGDGGENSSCADLLDHPVTKTFNVAPGNAVKVFWWSFTPNEGQRYGQELEYSSGNTIFTVLPTPTPTAEPTPTETPTPSEEPTPTPVTIFVPVFVSGSGSKVGTINVVKTVINDNSGTKTVADFPLFVNEEQVIPGVTNIFYAGNYTVTETGDSNYIRTFSGDCDINGQLNLSQGDNKFCVLTNDDIGPSVIIPPVPPLIEVVKVPSPLALPGGPGPVTYTYTLRNVGTVSVTNITMTGDTCSPIKLLSGDRNSNSQLDVNETWIHACSMVLPKTHINTVVAVGWANGISAVDIANATVVVGVPAVPRLPETGITPLIKKIAPPLIHLVQKPNIFVVPSGGEVVYTYTVTNLGKVALNNVSVVDDKCSSISGYSGDTNDNKLLDILEKWTYTCQTNLTVNTVLYKKSVQSL